MVFCKLPKTGLGNQLFVISHALIYARNNNEEITFLNYFQLKIGPYLRGEKNKRQYRGFFVFQKSWFAQIKAVCKFKLIKNELLVIEPNLKKSESKLNFVLFNEVPDYKVYFKKLEPWRNELLIELNKIFAKDIKRKIEQLAIIDVAVHIRLGDFKKLNSEVDFSKVGGFRTPHDYFINSIYNLKMINPDLNFYVFTDGRADEIEEILKIEHVQLFNSINDLVDLFQMANSKYLITSAGSTFSYWAAFLGNCQVIQHPYHISKIK